MNMSASGASPCGIAAGAEVHGQRKFGFLADAQDRIPVVGVKRRQAEFVRRLGEGDRLGALGGGAFDLGQDASMSQNGTIINGM